jgi:hypothetical protein
MEPIPHSRKGQWGREWKGGGDVTTAATMPHALRGREYEPPTTSGALSVSYWKRFEKIYLCSDENKKPSRAGMEFRSYSKRNLFR